MSDKKITAFIPVSVENELPEEARIEMIRKSGYYNTDKVYQYGFYDGYLFERSKLKPFSLPELMEEAIYAYNQGPYTDTSEKQFVTDFLTQKGII